MNLPTSGRWVAASFAVALSMLLIFIGSACGSADIQPESGGHPTATIHAREQGLTSTVSPKQTSTAPPATSPDPSSPISVQVVADSAGPAPPQGLAQTSDLVVVGHIAKFLPAQWATVNGNRPEDPATAVQADLIHSIITPVVVSLDSSPVVNHVGMNFSSRQIIILQLGGQVGQDSIQYSGVPTFKPGEHVILVLDRGSINNGARTLTSTAAGPAWDVTAKYVLTDNGDAIVNGKTQSAKALISELRVAGGTPTP